MGWGLSTARTLRGRACEQANSVPTAHSIIRKKAQKQLRAISQKRALSLPLPDGLGSQHCTNCLVKHLFEAPLCEGGTLKILHSSDLVCQLLTLLALHG